MKRCTHSLLLVCFVLAFVPLMAQKVYISKFASGDYISGDNHQIELFNESPRTVDLSGFMIMTRQYVARLPYGTRIAPWGTLRFGKSKKVGNIDIAYQRLEDFMIRIPTSRNENGDFAILFNKRSRILDAFFYSDRSRVSFLPAQESLMTQDNDLIKITAPNETSSVWSYIQMPPDPAMVFVRINGEWEINSRNQNLIAATEYHNLSASYVDGIITLKWSTSFERDCYYHIIERRLEGESFRILDRRPAIGNTSSPKSYIYYDNKIVENQSYEYRIRNTDKFGNTIYSGEERIGTGTDLGGLFLDHFREGSIQNIRFSSPENQNVRIQILDEEFRQITILFHDDVRADSQMLLQYKTPLPVGKYYLIAETPSQRLFKDFIVEN